jgi:hypothetical protein
MPYLTSKTLDSADPSIIRIPPITARKGWWGYMAKEFPWMATAAPGLLSLHATSCAAERNWSKWGLVFNDKLRNGLDVQRAAKMIFIAANYDQGARTSASSNLLVTQRFVQHS